MTWAGGQNFPSVGVSVAQVDFVTFGTEIVFRDFSLTCSPIAFPPFIIWMSAGESYIGPWMIINYNLLASEMIRSAPRGTLQVENKLGRALGNRPQSIHWIHFKIHPIDSPGKSHTQSTTLTYKMKLCHLSISLGMNTCGCHDTIKLW